MGEKLSTITIYYLLKYGLTLSKVRKWSREGVSLLTFNNQNLHNLKIETRKETISEKIEIKGDSYDSIFYLASVGLKVSIIEKLIEKQIYTISCFQTLEPENLSEIFEKKSTSLHQKVSRAIREYENNKEKYLEELSELDTFIRRNNIPRIDINLINKFTELEDDICIGDDLANVNKKFLVNKSISIYYLYQFNYKLNFTQLSSEQFSLMDCIFLNKKWFSLSEKNQKIIKLINTKGLEIPQNLFDDVLLLLGFGLNQQLVDLLIVNGIKEISKLKRMKISYLSRLFHEDSKKLDVIIQAISTFEEFCKIYPEEKIYYYISCLLKDNRGSFSKEKLKNTLMVKYHQEEKIIDDVIEILLSSSILKLDVYGNLNFYELELEDVFQSSLYGKEILLKRIMGETLQEISDVQCLSRERIRQKQKKILNNMPYIREDKYRSIIQKYAFSEEQFKLVFDETAQTYNYLKFRYGVGKIDILKYIETYDLEYDKKEKIIRDLNLVVYVDGSLVRATRRVLLEKYLFENREQYFLSEEIQPLYNRYVSESGFPEYCDTTIRGLCDGDTSDYIIRSNKRRFRFYNFFEIKNDPTIINLINTMLPETEGLYGVRYFEENYQNELEMLNLRDGFEFVNIIKRLGIDNFPKLNKILRGSELQIGEKDKSKFYEQVIKNNNGLHLNNIAQILADEYGLLYTTALSYMRKNFMDYFVEDISTVNIDIPTNVEFYDNLSRKLGKIIYSRKEIENIILCISGRNYIVSQALLSNVGYTCSGNIVFKSEYGSVKSAYVAAIKENLTFEIGHNEIFNSTYCYYILRELMQNFVMFQISKRKYISFDKLKDSGITKERLVDFVVSVEKYCPQGYFNLFSLEKDGFSHPLLDLGFENVFYERLLTTSEAFGYISTSKGILLTTLKEKTKLSELFYFELNEYGNSDEYDYYEHLLEKYGISFTEEKVRQKLLDIGAFYSKTMGKYYIDKESYYEEVYK